MRTQQFTANTFEIVNDDGVLLPYHIYKTDIRGEIPLYHVATGLPYDKDAVRISTYFDTRQECLDWLDGYLQSNALD